MPEIAIREERERRVIGIEHRGAYAAIGPAFQRLSGLVGGAGLWPEALAFLGVYLDDPRTVPEASLRSMAGIVVRDGLTVPETLAEMRVPAGRYAVLSHRGPYAGLRGAWARLHELMPTSGLAMRPAPACEIYRNAPGQVPDAELLTEICVPIS